MHMPSNDTSVTLPAGEIGEHLQVDTLPFDVKTIGGHVSSLVAIDEKLDFIMVVALKHETAGHVNQALVAVVNTVNSFGHKITDITSDLCSNLVSNAVNLGLLGITMHNTIPGKNVREWSESYKFS